MMGLLALDSTPEQQTFSSLETLSTYTYNDDDYDYEGVKFLEKVLSEIAERVPNFRAGVRVAENSVTPIYFRTSAACRVRAASPMRGCTRHEKGSSNLSSENFPDLFDSQSIYFSQILVIFTSFSVQYQYALLELNLFVLLLWNTVLLFLFYCSKVVSEIVEKLLIL